MTLILNQFLDLLLDQVKVSLELLLLGVKVLEFGAILVSLLAKVLDFSHQSRDRVGRNGLFVDSNKLSLVKASVLGFKILGQFLEAGVLLTGLGKILLSGIKMFLNFLALVELVLLLTAKFLTIHNEVS